MNTISLPRGLKVDGLNIETKIIDGTQWQIYKTFPEGYCLVVEPGLVKFWQDNGFQVDGIFSNYENLFVMASPIPEYIVALPYGPFSRNPYVIEEVIINTANSEKSYSKFDFSESIIISRYHIILPLRTNEIKQSYLKQALQRWISGGVMNIQDDSQFMNLISDKEYISELFCKAGIPISGNKGNNDKLNLSEKDQIPKYEKTDKEIPQQPFILHGRRDLSDFFNKRILNIIRDQERYLKLGISFPGGTLLYGPSGTGKTFAVEQLAKYLGWPVYYINSASVASPYIHETSKKISEVFSEAINNSPSVLIVDEMESYLSNRGISNSGTYHMEEVGEFLRLIPSAIDNNVLVFGMTNMLDVIDPAILRHGRFDNKIEVEPADIEDIIDLLKSELSNLPTENDIDIENLASRLEDNPLSDIIYVIRESGRIAAERKSDKISYNDLLGAVGLIQYSKDDKQIGFRFD